MKYSDYQAERLDCIWMKVLETVVRHFVTASGCCSTNGVYTCF